MKFLNLICIFLQIIKFIDGGKLFMIQVAPFTSTENVFSAVINTLAPFHQITYYTIMPKRFNNPNVTVIPLKLPQREKNHSNNTEELGKNNYLTIKQTTFSITKSYIKETFRINKNLQDLLKSNETYDLFFVRAHMSEHLLPLADVLKAALVFVSPSNQVPWLNEAMGNPTFLSYDHNFLIHKSNDKFLNRVYNYMVSFSITFLYDWKFIPTLDKICRKIYPRETQPLVTVMKNASLLLVNNHEAMGYSRPSLSNVVQIGGLHCHPPKPLPADLETFIQESGQHGVIYFSLGSAFDGKLPIMVRNTLLTVFKKIPQRVLWKTSEIFDNLPQNVFISKWFPQQDILGHKMVKVFITHGGMLSLQEAVYHGVPILAIPLIYDQSNNADFAQKLGYGKCLPINDITEERLTRDIQELINDKRYSDKIASLSSLMKDEPLSSAQKLIWWTDYLIRHKGFPMYRPRDNRYSLYNIIETDIFMFILTVIMLFIVSLYLIICFLRTKTISNFFTIQKLKVS